MIKPHQLLWFSVVWVCFVDVADSGAQNCDPAWDLSIGNPGLNSPVWSALSVDQTSAVGPALYAGGQFSTAGTQSAKGIARWNPPAEGSPEGWSPLGLGLDLGGTVYAMAIYDDGAGPALYVGGSFSSAGAAPNTRNIAKWDGAAWSDVGGGISYATTVRALAVFNGELYAGGLFNSIGGVTAYKIAKWNGVSWSAVGGNPLSTTDEVYTMTAHQGALYVGGSFSFPGNNIAQWDGSDWSVLGGGTNNEVHSSTVFEDALIVGGYFNEVYQSNGAPVAANKVGRWDGAAWSTLGIGMNSAATYHVLALTSFDQGDGAALYAGGTFTTAGGMSIPRIARWTSASGWSSLTGTNLNGYVYALAGFDNGVRPALYVGGTFTQNNGSPANRIARWNSALIHDPAGVGAEPPVITEGESSTLSAISAGTEIDWYAGSCGGGFVATGQTIVVSPMVTTTYYARARDAASGCQSPGCTAVLVTVLPAEAACCLPSGVCLDLLITECSGQGGNAQQPGSMCGGLPDQDGDGSPNVCDFCDNDPAKTHPGDCGCGTPDGDADADGVADCHDNCPTVPNPAQTNSDGDAWGDACDGKGDADHDGDLDLNDFAGFAYCHSLPGFPIGPGCAVFDFDDDGDVDLVDLGAMLAGFSVP